MLIEDILRQIIGQVLGLEKEEIKDESSLRYDLIITSISFIKIVTEIEDYFNVEVDDEDLDIEEDMNFKTLCEKVRRIVNQD